MDFLEYMELCRLCLAKEKATIPIFEAEGSRQVFIKIETCLPVKVSQTDSLPKKICNDCFKKVDKLYEFWHTAAKSEKQLQDRLIRISSDNMCVSGISELQSEDKRGIVKEERILESEQVTSLYQKNDFYFEAISEFSNDSNDAIDDCSEVQVKIEVQDNKLADPGPSGIQSSVTSQLEKDEAKYQVEEHTDLCNSILQKKNDEIGTTDNINKCYVCSRIFKNRVWYERHMQGHRENKRFGCDLCGKTFKLNSTLRSHQREIHSAEKKLKCSDCNYATNNKTNFKSHIKIKHTDVNVHGIKCDLCDARCFREEDLMRHKIKKHNAPKFKCNFCERSYTTKQYLHIHEAIHKPNFRAEHQCITCGKMFPNNNLLSSHVRGSHLGLSYECKECGKIVSTQSSLRDHMNIHTGVKPYVCDVCGKGFRGCTYLRTHLRSHTGERPYSCKHCHKTFTQRSSLIVHERYHSGERPFQCLLCLKEFVAKSLLNNHMKAHKHA